MYFGAIGVDSDVCQQGHDFSLVQAVHAGYAVVLSPSSCSETYTYPRGGPSFLGLLLVFGNRLVWLFAINRTTIPRIYSCSELVCAIVDLGIVGLSVMCAHCGHNLFIYLCKT